MITGNKPTILITGILGYIARGFCEIIDTKKFNIIGIDNRFLPDKVSWLVENGIKYYNKDLFNIKDLIKEADVIIHTAGITKVPTVKSQSNPEIDTEIMKVGVGGTREIIQHASKHTKIIFLSTHVIFESIQDSTIIVTENDEPRPNLFYAQSKYQSELDLIGSARNFKILRLASVYGYNDCIRWSILPNLFSKMASQNQNLKVFGQGNNIKPIVGIKDVCRCIKFLINYDKGNLEIYNLVSEHKTVKEIATICQSVNPYIELEFTEDEIPNLGYKLSNEKILKTGFKFKQNISDEIKKMIRIWKNK